MTTDTKPETIEVDLHGIKVPLPKEQADKLIAARDAEKARHRELAERVGKSDAEKAAAEAARAKAADDLQIMEHATKKELEQVRALASKDANERLSKIATKLRDKHLAAALTANPVMVPSAIPDVIDALKNRVAYDPESDAVVVLDEGGRPSKDEAGKPVQVDAWLGDWLAKRPHYLLDKTAAGNGGKATSKAGGKVIPQSALATMSPLERAKFFADGGSLAP